MLAHPDDEALGCGALLPRLVDSRLIHVTDGAPANGDDARRHGFADAAAYARARAGETRNALAASGRPDLPVVCLGIPDQGAAHDLVGIARRLLPRLADCEVVLTHACEGGHPDHDATAFAVACAVELLVRDGDAPIVVEMPFYRAGPDGAWIRQRFADEAGVAMLDLTPVERATKRAMFAAHASQAETLSSFPIAAEHYRVASVERDFAILPNGGDLLYERHGWGLDGTRWLACVREARHELFAWA